MKRQDVYKVIDQERDYQNSIWSPNHMTDGVPADVEKQVAHFIVYMDDYMRKAKEQFTGNSGDRGALENLRKVVALGVACFERHGVPARNLNENTGLNSYPQGYYNGGKYPSTQGYVFPQPGSAMSFTNTQSQIPTSHT